MLRTSRTFEYEGVATDYEQPFGVSQTIPDMGMTIREILTKHATGLPLGHATREGYYDDDYEDEMPDVSQMSKIELAEYSAELNGSIADMREQLQDIEDRLSVEQQQGQPSGEGESGDSKIEA